MHDQDGFSSARKRRRSSRFAGAVQAAARGSFAVWPSARLIRGVESCYADFL